MIPDGSRHFGAADGFAGGQRLGLAYADRS